MKKNFRENLNLKIKKAALGIVLTCSAWGASANTITFDDIGTADSGTLLSSGYAGLNWSNFGVLDVDDNGSHGPSGYQNSAVSHSNVAFNWFADDASFSAASAFTFNSVYITAAWNDGLNVQVTGFLNGIETYSSLLTVSTNGASFQTFNWSNVDEVSFHSFGGIPNPNFTGGGTHFAMDNLMISAVPEPRSYAMMMAGLVLMGVVVSRRKVKQHDLIANDYSRQT